MDPQIDETADLELDVELDTVGYEGPPEFEAPQAIDDGQDSDD